MDVAAVAPVLEGIAAVLAGATDGGERQGHLSDARRRCSGLAELAPAAVAGASKPVVDDHLAAALEAVEGSSESLVEGVRRLAPQLHWFRSYPDVEPGDPVMDRFLDNYAYTVIAGPTGDRWPESPVDADDTVVGLTLQAPGIFYPAHAHPAVELYGVIGGSGAWKRGDEDWVTRKPGSAFVHVAHETHIMETHEEPMLSWFVWTSDLDGTVDLV